MNDILRDDLLTNDYVNQLNQQQVQNHAMQNATVRGIGTFVEAGAEIGTEVAAHRIGDAVVSSGSTEIGSALSEGATEIGGALSGGATEIGSALAEGTAGAGSALLECAAEVGGTILGGIAEFICACIAGICDGL